ncbi:hypothetical protein AURDEDRAFT_155208 [Auricularia subglabra TFB-10046 SS5]|nr:hypothetical protein AURDEDRAFT_155208 [Auricularia subglabra TFB-10046 SS5]
MQSSELPVLYVDWDSLNGFTINQLVPTTASAGQGETKGAFTPPSPRPTLSSALQSGLRTFKKPWTLGIRSVSRLLRRCVLKVSLTRALPSDQSICPLLGLPMELVLDIRLADKVKRFHMDWYTDCNTLKGQIDSISLYEYLQVYLIPLLPNLRILTVPEAFAHIERLVLDFDLLKALQQSADVATYTRIWCLEIRSSEAQLSVWQTTQDLDATTGSNILRPFPCITTLILRDLLWSESRDDGGIPSWLVTIEEDVPALHTVMDPSDVVWKKRAVGGSSWVKHEAQGEALESLYPWYEMP